MREFFLGPPALERQLLVAGGISHNSQFQQFYDRFFCAILPLVFSRNLWYTIGVKGREVHTLWLCGIVGVDDLSCAGSKKNVKNP